MYEAPEVRSIPMSNETNLLLSKGKVQVKENGRPQVSTSDIAYLLFQDAISDQDNPFHDFSRHNVRRQLKRFADEDGKDPAIINKSGYSPRAEELLHLAQFFAAASESPEVTKWHLGFALATDELFSHENRTSTFAMAGVDPIAVMEKFTQEKIDIKANRFEGTLPFAKKSNKNIAA